MRFSPVFARRCALAAIALVAAVAGLGFTMLRPHEEIPQVADCNVFGGIADYAGASSLDNLVEESDVVVKGRITRRSNTYDTETRTGVHPYRQLIFYTVDVHDVLVGDVSGQSITFGIGIALARDVCLDPGDEFYLFLAKSRKTGNPYTENPVEYGLPFGYDVVFAVESGVVRRLKPLPALEEVGGTLHLFDGMPEDSFRKAVIESATRVH